MQAQMAENSVMIESMRHEVSQAKSDKAKTEDQLLIRDLQINEAERLAELQSKNAEQEDENEDMGRHQIKNFLNQESGIFK